MVQSSLSRRKIVGKEEKKIRHSHNNVVPFSVLVCFTGRHNAHSTQVPALEWRIFIESILLIESILYSLLSSQCVTSDRFTLCCVEYLSCVSVLVPLAQQPRRPPCEVDTQYSSPGDVNRGFAGLLKSLLHRDRHFWFYPWCYVQEWRPTSDAWRCCDTFINSSLPINGTDVVLKQEAVAGCCFWGGQTGAQARQTKALVVKRRTCLLVSACSFNPCSSYVDSNF